MIHWHDKGAPDWYAIGRTIRRKYDRDREERVILDAKIDWYWRVQDWELTTDAFLRKWEKYGIDVSNPMAAGAINNTIIKIFFPHVTDSSTLLKAARWQKVVVDALPEDPNPLDTYANLLYKAGRLQEAIVLEKNALNLAEVKAKKANRRVDPLFQQTIDRMSAGQPTW